jgi:hypothetical protein
VAQLYRHARSQQPEFVWVRSPAAGSDLIVAEGLSTPMSFDGNEIHRASARIATLVSESRRRMDAGIGRRRPDWPYERRIRSSPTSSPHHVDAIGEVTALRSGIAALRCGRNPHILVADEGVCIWSTPVSDPRRLALGILDARVSAYLIHPEHGATGIAPGLYVINE